MRIINLVELSKNMKNKFLSGLLTLVLSTVLLAQPVEAGLWSYYNNELGQSLPSKEVRASYAEDIGIQNYSGTFQENVKLEKYLRDVNYWENKVKTGDVSESQIALVPERVWKRLIPQVIQTVKQPAKNEESLGFGDPILGKETTCLDTACDALLTREEQSLGFSVASRYRVALQSSMTSVQTTVPVSTLSTFDGHTLTMADLGNSVYLTLEPGSSREEITKCTSITSSQWSGCTRGLAFYGTSTVSVSANRKAHNAGSLVVMSNVHYVYDELADKDDNETLSGLKTFTSLPITTSTSALCTTNNQFCTKYYIDNVGAGGFTSANVSTTRGLSVDGSVPERVGINASSTTGIKFDGSGRLYQAVSSTRALAQDSNGIYVTTTQNLVFNSLGQLDINATSTPTASSVPIASTTGFLDSWVTGGYFGDALDGTYTLNGSQGAVSGLFSYSNPTYTLLKDANFLNLTIANGYTLNTNGYSFSVLGTLTNAGTIDNSGANGSQPTGAAGGSIGGAGGAGGAGNSLDGGTAGGAGSSRKISSGVGGSGVAGASKSPSIGSAGAAGGGGGAINGTYTTSTPGAAGTVTQEYLTISLPFNIGTSTLSDGLETTNNTFLVASGATSSIRLSASAGSGGGGAGAGSDSNSIGGGGGGGGGSGGIIQISARIIINTGAIQSNGGNGGNGAAGDTSNGSSNNAGGGGGGSGSGGVIILIYKTLTDSGQIRAVAGIPGSGGAKTGVANPGATGGTGNSGKIYKFKVR